MKACCDRIVGYALEFVGEHFSGAYLRSYFREIC